MPRTFGYIFLAIAALIGIGALLLPMPEQIEIAKVEEPKQEIERPAPLTPQARPRPKKASPPKPETKPAVKGFPMQDTTKARVLIKPEKEG